MTSTEICTDIIKCLHNAWMDDMVFDFTVKIQDETVPCHRFMLVACSDFFKGLFRSGMREATDNCVVLEDVSCNVFRLILRTIYTGENLLNLDNFIDVWRAVDMLQINFMVNLCENFAIQSLTIDTLENIYINAKIVNSNSVLKQLHLFMLKNFETISLSRTFLQLTYKEMYDLIESKDLVADNEDLVLESVIKWVEYVPKTNVDVNDGSSTDEHSNENKYKLDTVDQHSSHSLDVLVCEDLSRKDKLTELLEQVRTCLVSPTVLSRVLKLELFENSRDIIDDALSYHGQDFKHGQRPSAAIHRSCSGYMYGWAIATQVGNVILISESGDKFYSLRHSSQFQKIYKLVNFNGELYAIGKTQATRNFPCRMFVFRDKKWKFVTAMPSHDLRLVARDEFLYIFNKDDHKMYIINPKKARRKLENFTDCPAQLNIEHAMDFNNILLVFGSEACTNNDETAVYKLDISSKVWTRLDNIEGPAEQLLSFSTDKNHYIYQKNGSLSLVRSESENVEFRLLGKISNVKIEVYGGFVYKSKLVFLGYFEEQDALCKRMPVPSSTGIDLKTFRFWQMNGYEFSNLVPITLPTVCFDEVDTSYIKKRYYYSK